MRIEEVAVAGPRMAPGRGARPTLQHELAAHELAIIFADRAFYRSEAGIGQIGGAGPFPDIAEQVAQAVSRAGRARPDRDRKSTRLNSSHQCASRLSSYA